MTSPTPRADIIKCIIWTIVLAALCLALDRLHGAPGDTPSGQVQITLTWDPSPPGEEVVAYYVRQSTNVLGPWSVVSSTVSTNAVLTLPAPGRWFWIVTASNWWGESVPSNTNSTPLPAGKVGALTLTR